MKESRLSEEADQQYATAYDMHYTTKDIHKAFTLYEDIIAAHPDTKEAGYSKSQIQAKTDIGKVIGKQGRTADALQTLLSDVSAKAKKRALLEIVG